MRLKALKLRNFRGYRGTVTIPLEDLTTLVGKNDVGKSSILDALAIFFGFGDAKFDPGDYCVHAREDEVRIGCVFSDLPDELVLDATCRTTLADEYLLNSDGDLEIHKVYRCQNGKASKERVVAVALHPTAPEVDSLLSLKNSDLKRLVQKLCVDASSIDRRSNPSMRRAIWASTEDLRRREVDIDLNKEDAKAIWQQLQRELPSFALFRADRPSTDKDMEVQDPMKLAVKQALAAVEDELEKIKSQVQQETLRVAERTLEKLRELDPSLAKELRPAFRAEPKWDRIFDLSLTSDDQIPINKRGSGVRRLILLSFFRAEAERRREEEGKRNLIYAIEEPETSQHPQNQRMLIDALSDLASEDGCQVIITTHVPALAGLVPIDGIRHITVLPDGSRQVETPTEDTLRRIADDLGVLPDERVQVFVCVEGPNDVRFLRHMSRLLREEDPSLPDLTDDPRIVILPLGGSTLKDWVNNHYLRPLNKPEVHIYDSDGEDPPRYQKECEEVNGRQDGSRAFITKKRETENYVHAAAIKQVFGIEVTVDDDVDMGELVARAVHEASESPRPWDELDDEKKGKKISRAKRRLNDEVAARMTLEWLEERGGKEEIQEWLEAIRVILE